MRTDYGSYEESEATKKARREFTKRRKQRDSWKATRCRRSDWTVAQLIDALRAMPPDAEVKLALCPWAPEETPISAVTHMGPQNTERPYCDSVVYITPALTKQRYLPGGACENLGWDGTATEAWRNE